MLVRRPVPWLCRVGWLEVSCGGGVMHGHDNGAVPPSLLHEELDTHHKISRRHKQLHEELDTHHKIPRRHKQSTPRVGEVLNGHGDDIH